MTHPNRVLLLGAGASAPAEVPLARQFVTTLRETLREDDEKSRRADLLAAQLDRLVEFLTVRLGPAAVDIESVYETVVRLAERRSDPLLDPGSNEPLDAQTAAELKLCTERHIRTRAFVTPEQTRFLDELMTLRDTEPLTVFSTNYDTCVEVMCERHRLRWEDGFRVRWDPAVFRSRGIDVRLHKLHGSVLWYRDEQGGYLRSVLRPEPQASDRVRWFGGFCDPLLIYPARKSAQDAPYSYNLARLYTELSRARRDVQLVAIGYSFRDAHIRRVLFNAALANPSLSVVLIDPRATEIFEQELALHAGEPSALIDRVFCIDSSLDREGVLLRGLRQHLDLHASIVRTERTLRTASVRDETAYRGLAEQYASHGDRHGYVRSVRASQASEPPLPPPARLHHTLLRMLLAARCGLPESTVRREVESTCTELRAALGDVVAATRSSAAESATVDLKFLVGPSEIETAFNNAQALVAGALRRTTPPARTRVTGYGEWLAWVRKLPGAMARPVDRTTRVSVAALVACGVPIAAASETELASRLEPLVREGLDQFFTQAAPQRLLADLGYVACAE